MSYDLFILFESPYEQNPKMEVHQIRQMIGQQIVLL